MGEYYGIGRYGRGGYKGEDEGNEYPELHYYALKKQDPTANIPGFTDADLHAIGRMLDDVFYTYQAIYTNLFCDTALGLQERWRTLLDVRDTFNNPSDIPAALRAKQRIMANKNGRLSIPFYKSVVEGYGFTGVTITENTTRFIVADALPQCSVVSDNPADLISDKASWCRWQIHVTGGPTDATTRSIYEATIKKIKPAWTRVYFFYDYIFVGSKKTITWNSENIPDVDSVYIELSRDAGVSWEYIATVLNTGTYSWTTTAPGTTLAIIKISAVDNDTLLPDYDRSEQSSIFTINN
jgi:uncharacterized protein YmfQ (DUF2313 family)